MRIIFMGTPDFSVGTLEALVEAGHDVCLAVTQPDKPKGRGKERRYRQAKSQEKEYEQKGMPELRQEDETTVYRFAAL